MAPLKRTAEPAFDPARLAIENASVDDEPYTDDERAADEAARKAPRSEDVSSAELRRILSL